MATKLFLRNSHLNGIKDSGDDTVFDMITTQGSGAAAIRVTAASSGTEIQWTDGSLKAAFISGRVPSGGFTLTTTDISIWALESLMTTNVGGRYRVFRYQPGGTVTELGGGPFDDGVEFGTANGNFTWVGNVTDQAFNENDRILLRIYITNIGTMGTGTADLNFEGGVASSGDSFFNLNETITFKDEDTFLSQAVM